MTKTYQTVSEALDNPIPRDVVRERESGGGRTLSYLEGHYVIDRLNKVLGIGNWATQITELKNVFSGEVGNKHSAHYTCRVRLVVELPEGKRTEYEDVGYGNGYDKTDPGKPHELAVKEAVTDAIKRTAKNLGMSMGLALYDKDQTNVVDTLVEANTEMNVTSINTPAVIPAAISAKETNIKLLANLGKVAIAKKKYTKESLQEKVRSFGVASIKELSDEQVTSFITTLKGEVGYEQAS